MTLVELTESDVPSCGVILMTLEVSFTIIICFIIYAPRVINYAPRNIYSTGSTHDNHHLRLSYFYSTGHRLLKEDAVTIYLNLFLQIFILLTVSELAYIRSS
jgi:hypothetical protein